MGKHRRFGIDQLQEKKQALRSDKDVERLDDMKEARPDGGRRLQREGLATEKDRIIERVNIYTLSSLGYRQSFLDLAHQIYSSYSAEQFSLGSQLSSHLLLALACLTRWLLGSMRRRR